MFIFTLFKSYKSLWKVICTKGDKPYKIEKYFTLCELNLRNVLWFKIKSTRALDF